MRKIKRILESIKSTVSSCILCIRFPFLYPRNRITGLHYTNWTFINKISELKNKYRISEFTRDKNDIDKLYNKPRNKYNLKIEQMTLDMYNYSYWKSRWAMYWAGLLQWINDVLLQIVFFIPTYNELDNMPTGWRKAFGIQMCKEIKRELKRVGMLRKYRITQIKEKYGTLRWYDSCAPVEVRKIIHKYEYISGHTCIVCGRNATYITEGWISPYCADHVDVSGSRAIKKPFGLTDLKWYGWDGNISDLPEEEWNSYANVKKKRVRTVKPKE